MACRLGLLSFAVALLALSSCAQPPLTDRLASLDALWHTNPLDANGIERLANQLRDEAKNEPAPFIAILRSPAAPVAARREAAFVMGQPATAQAAPYLYEATMSDDEKLSFDATLALGGIGAQHVTPQWAVLISQRLESFLRQPPNPKLPGVAAIWFRSYPETEAVAKLSGLLRSLGFASTGGRGAASALMGLARWSKDPATRKVADAAFAEQELADPADKDRIEELRTSANENPGPGL